MRREPIDVGYYSMSHSSSWCGCKFTSKCSTFVGHDPWFNNRGPKSFFKTIPQVSMLHIARLHYVHRSMHVHDGEYHVHCDNQYQRLTSTLCIVHSSCVSARSAREVSSHNSITGAWKNYKPTEARDTVGSDFFTNEDCLKQQHCLDICTTVDPMDLKNV